jgi:hypothetical protein
MWLTTSNRPGDLYHESTAPSRLDRRRGRLATDRHGVLAEKERRSGSKRIVQGYARMLWPFLGGFHSPAEVTPAHVLAWAHGDRAFLQQLVGIDPGS